MPYSCSQGSIPHLYLNPRHLNRTLFTLRRKQRRAGLLSGAIRRPPPLCQRYLMRSRTPGEIITDIQRELARRGYYNGPVDGLYGQRTDGAIRDFERAAGLKLSAQPSEALLQAITQSPLTPGKGARKHSCQLGRIGRQHPRRLNQQPCRHGSLPCSGH